VSFARLTVAVTLELPFPGNVQPRGVLFAGDLPCLAAPFFLASFPAHKEVNVCVTA
jgi:hypothetical protein